jgi:hypothetical protein
MLRTIGVMTKPEGAAFDDEAPEADVVEQHTPVDLSDEDTWLDTDRVADARDSEANEADLIDQAIVVPEGDSEFDR